MDDLRELIIYIIIGLIGVIASAYQNKQKRKQAGSKPSARPVPRDILTEPRQEFEPDLGPLMELFEIPRKVQEPLEESVESGPAVEEGGLMVDTQEASLELEGMKAEAEGFAQETSLPTPTFEEGQSDIQKMIAKYDAIREEFENEYDRDDIASGEIVSVEAEALARLKSLPDEPVFVLRKAIIYSEILKRKEF
jgi:hypothetical protein